MSTQGDFRLVIIWEHEIRKAGDALKRACDLNETTKHDSSEEDRKVFSDAMSDALNLCVAALRGVNTDASTQIVMSAAPAKLRGQTPPRRVVDVKAFKQHKPPTGDQP
jgi:hypothetical protein